MVALLVGRHVVRCAAVVVEELGVGACAQEPLDGDGVPGSGSEVQRGGAGVVAVAAAGSGTT